MKEDVTKAVKPQFTYQVELAGYDFGQSDQKGQIDSLSFTRNFDEFPWAEQVERANQIGKVAPTLTVDDNVKHEALWVSAMGDKNKQIFLLGYVYRKEVKSFFGLGKAATRNWIEIYLTEDNAVVKESFRLFFESNADALRLRLASLEKYDEMESRIQD